MTLQVGALITIGCILSVDTKVDETLIAMKKDKLLTKVSNLQISNERSAEFEECDDFEEGYSDDEIESSEKENNKHKNHEVNNKFQIGSCFKYWILDICFKNLGWLFKGDERLVRYYFFLLCLVATHLF